MPILHDKTNYKKEKMITLRISLTDYKRLKKMDSISDTVRAGIRQFFQFRDRVAPCLRRLLVQLNKLTDGVDFMEANPNVKNIEDIISDSFAELQKINRLTGFQKL